MLKIWDAANFRRTAGGLALILAPLVFAVAEITFPGGNGGPVDLLNAASRDRTLVLVDTYLGILAGILFVPAFFAVLRVIQGRGVVLAHLAVVIGVPGVLLAHVAKAALQLMIWVMASPGVDRAAMVTFLNGGGQSAAILPLFLGDELFALGVILLGIALWRSGFGYRWAGPAIALGLVMDIVLSSLPLPDVVASIVSDGLLVAGFAAVGYRVLAAPGDTRVSSADQVRDASPISGVATQA
ncbi:MAG TPA: hypothetical protein VF160_15695 [Candidatus Dormibacteraeota bacterium]